MAEPVRILFVDDEENILNALLRLFDDEPYELLTASSGAEGLAVLRKETGVGVIVTDQRMPSMTGTEFLVWARDIAPKAVRVILTGYADIHAAVDAINEGGAYRYTAKPWQDDELLQIVRDAARQYELLRENERLEKIVREQNEELKEWTEELERRVTKQIRQIREQNVILQELNARLKKSFDDTLASFAGLLELRDPSERNHSGNVAAVAEAMAISAALPEEEVQTVRVAALIHDIGKVGGVDIPSDAGTQILTPEQWRSYKEHPVRGQTVVDSIEALRSAGKLIRYHHERWDGDGFPDGLRGAAIPFGARIVAMADFVDREMAKCRGGNASDLVLAALREEILGGRFDPALLFHARKVVPAICARASLANGAFEEEVDISELREGMTLSRDVLSGTGVLLLRSGSVLGPAAISALIRHSELDPSRTGVFVFRVC